MSNYAFPPNKRAEVNTDAEQVLKACEEFGEFIQAFNKRGLNDPATMEEFYDLKYALEGIERRFDEAKAEDVIIGVAHKAFMRGDI